MTPNRCRSCRSLAAQRDGSCPVFGDAPCLALDGGTMIGEVLGDRYELLQVLAAGAMGTVYRAWQRSTNRDVAVKVLSAELAPQTDEAQRFVDEAKALGRLSTPHAVGMVDFGSTGDGRPYLVMELLHGVTLRELVAAGGPLSVPRALRLCAQVLDALQSAHGVGIVHRDLKPDNLMLLRGNRQRDFVKLLDFGIAHLRDAPGNGVRQPMIGTPTCMAPEQITGDAIDGRTDLYALGCVLHFLITGRFPFDDSPPRAMLRRKLESVSRGFASGLPEREQTAELRALLEALLARHPDDRPASASAAARLVEAALRACPSAPRGACDWLGSDSSQAPIRVTDANRAHLTWVLERTEELASRAHLATQQAMPDDAPVGHRAIQAALTQDAALYERWLLDQQRRLQTADAAWSPGELLDVERPALRLTVFGLSHAEREAAARGGELERLLGRVTAAHRELARFLETGARAPEAEGTSQFCALLTIDQRSYLDDLLAATVFLEPRRTAN